jgi:hypothetical protein
LKWHSHQKREDRRRRRRHPHFSPQPSLTNDRSINQSNESTTTKPHNHGSNSWKH